MRIFGIAGYSGMGKTTLLELLIPEIKQRGLRVSLIKHSHKDIEIDRPGKDSFRLREAGCTEVLLLGRTRWALMHELRGEPEPSLDDLLTRLQDCDLVLVEGFKESDLLKIEVWRAPEPGKSERPVRYPEDGFVVAIATDAPDQLPEPTLRPVLDLNAPAEVVDWMLQNADRFEYDWEMHGEALR